MSKHLRDLQEKAGIRTAKLHQRVDVESAQNGLKAFQEGEGLGQLSKHLTGKARTVNGD